MTPPEWGRLFRWEDANRGMVITDLEQVREADMSFEPVGSILPRALDRIARDLRRPPRFDPPHDSPIEDRFAERADRLFRRGVRLESQVPVITAAGSFRLDFVARLRDRVVAFECDGKDFHIYIRDAWRDAAILHTGVVDAVYRIPGASINYAMDDLSFALSVLEPWLVTKRTRWAAKQNASAEAKLARRGWLYGPQFPLGTTPRFTITKHCRTDPHLQRIGAYVATSGGGSLDDIITRRMEGTA
jgi:hypothetical protein